MREIVGSINSRTFGPKLHISSIYRPRRLGNAKGHHFGWKVLRYKAEEVDEINAALQRWRQAVFVIATPDVWGLASDREGTE